MALKDITLGQYFPGNSLVHRLDPRTKLLAVVLYIVALFLADFFVSYAIMFALLALSIAVSRVPLKSIMRGMKPILFIAIFTAVLNLFYTDGTHVLVYVYRPSRLRADLCRPEAERLLRPYGYTATDEESALQRLRERLSAGGDFPHEIGAFLGYPLEDVAGYIHNRGQNCRCMGCWKVYCNECEARRTFAKLKKCSEVYGRLWRQGRTVPELTVAA